MKFTTKELWFCEYLDIPILESDCRQETVTGIFSYYRCPNEDCNYSTILRSYNFCPLCGFPINWIDPETKENCLGDIEHGTNY